MALRGRCKLRGRGPASAVRPALGEEQVAPLCIFIESGRPPRAGSRAPPGVLGTIALPLGEMVEVFALLVQRTDIVQKSKSFFLYIE